jgi:hypothetical protein
LQVCFYRLARNACGSHQLLDSKDVFDPIRLLVRNCMGWRGEIKELRLLFVHHNRICDVRIHGRFIASALLALSLQDGDEQIAKPWKGSIDPKSLCGE